MKAKEVEKTQINRYDVSMMGVKVDERIKID